MSIQSNVTRRPSAATVIRHAHKRAHCHESLGLFTSYVERMEHGDEKICEAFRVGLIQHLQSPDWDKAMLLALAHACRDDMERNVQADCN